MTQDEIMDTARQAGFVVTHIGDPIGTNYAMIEAFAQLVAVKERERIFDLLHEMHVKAKGRHNHYLHAVVTLKQRGEE